MAAALVQDAFAPLKFGLDEPSMAASSRMGAPSTSGSRLSPEHGATIESIAAYVDGLGNSLQNQISGRDDDWSPSTANVGDCYRFLKDLGRGHFGVVRLCEERFSRHQYACKTILKSSIKKDEDVDELCSEVGSMLRLQQYRSRHENIVQFHELLEDEEAVHLVLEYCSGGDLFDHISSQKQLSEKEAANILKQLVSAIRYMHRCGLVHRDLKPENILIAKARGFNKGMPRVKVADFGLSVYLNEGQMATGVAGSPFYMAPQVVRGKPYGREADVWSLGVILYTALAGFLPFWGRGTEDVFAAVCRGHVDFSRKQWAAISPQAKHLVHRMLSSDPVMRITMDQILCHPWMLHNCPELRLQTSMGQEDPICKKTKLSSAPSFTAEVHGNVFMASRPICIPVPQQLPANFRRHT